MRRTFPDIFSDVFIFFARPIINLIMSREIKVIHEGDIIKRKKEPFIIISNHFNTWDAFVLMKHVKKNVRFVATEIAYLDFTKKLGMAHLARTIKKRVGKRDVLATRRIFEALKQNYAVGVFPEGDNTFYGETLDIYKSTGKLLKKCNVDVFLIKQQGGYISQPRWADYFSKKGVVHTSTKLLFSKEELQILSPESINHRVEEELYNNDYDFQRSKMYDFDRTDRAEGIERLIYYCNQCHSILTVYGEGHDIKCSKCGTIGTINNYEFIEQNEFDNLVDYNHYQFSHIEEVINSEFCFDVTHNIVDTQKLKNINKGTYKVSYKNKQLTINNGSHKQTFDLDKIKYPVNTMRHSFSFDYEGVTYNFTDIRHQFVLYEMCRYLNGSYKE